MSNLAHPKLAAEQQAIREARARGRLPLFLTYLKLSGPGWLQSAMTLGGGSLAGSLYLGVIGGVALLWLQPVAIIMGVIMLAAISYVTLSTGERPFYAIKNHINPVLAWGWALASLLANVVWAMPQFALANGVVQHNLLPGIFGPESNMDDFTSKIIITAFILVITLTISFWYGNKNWGVRLYELTLKLMVMMIVLCFVGVVLRVTFSPEGISWGRILAGYIPDFTLFWRPQDAFLPLLNAIGDESVRAFWLNHIVNEQQNIMIAATATAVGINMTFLMPYSLLARGWNKDFRGLSICDLSIGMVIPFVFATSCVIIASASQFNTVPVTGLVDEQGAIIASEEHPRWGHFNGMINQRGQAISFDDSPVSNEERYLAATLLRRDAGDLAQSLTPLTGSFIANLIFGLGVLGMTLSTITVMMIISGMVLCEIFNIPQQGWKYRLCCMAAMTGALGPFFWGDVSFWLAVPTSVFNYTFLPLAFISFFLMMNSKRLLGEHLPQGSSRLIWNTLMGVAVTLTTIGAVWQIHRNAGTYGMIALAVFVIAVILAHKREPLEEIEKPVESNSAE